MLLASIVQVRNQQRCLVPTEASAWIKGTVIIQSEKDDVRVILAIPWVQDVSPNKTVSTD